MEFSYKLKHWIKDKFTIYLPHEFKVPLAWFIISVIIGTIIQSVKVNHLVFIDFFYTNYIQWLSYFSTFIDATYLFGFGVLLSFLLQTAYYLVATISLAILLFRIIVSLDEHNTRKIVGWLIVIILVAFIFIKYIPHANFDVSKTETISKYKGCPEDIIPDIVTFEIEEGVTYMGSYDGLYPDPHYSKSEWLDSQPIEKYVSEGSIKWPGPSCKKGLSEGQNINYYYCDNLHYFKSATPISEEGTIGKTEVREYIISLVLKEKNRYQDMGEWKWQERIYGDFEVINGECRNPSK